MANFMSCEFHLKQTNKKANIALLCCCLIWEWTGQEHFRALTVSMEYMIAQVQSQSPTNREVGDMLLAPSGFDRLTACNGKTAAWVNNEVTATQNRGGEPDQELRSIPKGWGYLPCEIPGLEVLLFVWCKGKFMLASASALFSLHSVS